MPCDEEAMGIDLPDFLLHYNGRTPAVIGSYREKMERNGWLKKRGNENWLKAIGPEEEKKETCKRLRIMDHQQTPIAFLFFLSFSFSPVDHFLFLSNRLICSLSLWFHVGHLKHIHTKKSLEHTICYPFRFQEGKKKMKLSWASIFLPLSLPRILIVKRSFSFLLFKSLKQMIECRGIKRKGCLSWSHEVKS